MVTPWTIVNGIDVPASLPRGATCREPEATDPGDAVMAPIENGACAAAGTGSTRTSQSPTTPTKVETRTGPMTTSAPILRKVLRE